MGKNLKISAKIAFFAFIALNWFAPFISRAEHFESLKDKFSLEYDPVFTPTPVEQYNVGIALRHKETAYPTFNVIIEAGYVDISASNKDKEKAFLDSYRSVGITNASVISSENQIVNNSPCFTAEISYKLGNADLISKVSLFNSSERHYILTYIDTAEGYKSSKHFADNIISSFKILDEIPSFAPEKNANFLNNHTIFFLIFFVILILSLGLRKFSARS